jgi:hypothetical protein
MPTISFDLFAKSLRVTEFPPELLKRPHLKHIMAEHFPSEPRMSLTFAGRARSRIRFAYCTTSFRCFWRSVSAWAFARGLFCRRSLRCGRGGPGLLAAVALARVQCWRASPGTLHATQGVLDGVRLPAPLAGASAAFDQIPGRRRLRKRKFIEF